MELSIWTLALLPVRPPSYAERAVPEFHAPRLGSRRLVVLLAHCQGAGLPEPGPLAVIGYGNPMRRLYARYVPS